MRIPAIASAPRWRGMLAGLADLAIAAGVGSLWRRGMGSPAAVRPARWMALVRPAAELLREQLGSPGQRLLGIRTVDRRTGRRVELWRTLVLLGAGAGGQLIVRRLAPPGQTPEQEREREHFLEELKAVHERHAAGSPERDTELEALLERHPGAVTVNMWRSMAPTLAVGLVNWRLRARVAPTSEILVRSRSHSP
jgi:hypothetical protein